MAKVMISLPDELLSRIDHEANRRGTTRSALLREAVSRELAPPDSTPRGLRLAEAPARFAERPGGAGAALAERAPVDASLLGALAARHPDMPTSDALAEAVKSYLERDAARRLTELAGTFEVDDVSASLRATDRHS